MTKRSCSFAFALMISSGATFAADGTVMTSDWKSDWLKARNQLIETSPKLEFDPSSVIVRFEDGADEKLIEALKVFAGVRVEPIQTWAILPGVEHLNVLGNDAEAVVAKLNELPGVVYAELDYIVRTSVNPNDSSFTQLWGMNNTGQTVNGDPGVADADIDASEAWDITTGSSSQVIAIVDSGLNYNHPDIAANAWLNPGEIAGNGVDDDGNGYIDDMRGWDFYSNDSDPMDDNGHGTHCGGTVGGVGNNGLGVAGVNWQCKMMGLKFLSASGSGSTTGAISAVNYIVGKGVKASNNSWGGGGYSQALFDAINASRANNHVFVAAAGNNNTNTDSTIYYPQGYALDNIISVAASDNNDQRASFSNYGRTTVDLAAPGVNIYSTYSTTPTGTGYAYLNGTSMATPHVTGVVALVQSRNPSWTYTQVRDRIMSTVRPAAAFSTNTVTGGILNAFAAVNDGIPVNNAPTVAISSPTNGSSFLPESVVTFSGTANDAEDGVLTSALSWTSSIDGAIGTGGSFSAILSVGTHTISASATDSGGRAGSSSVTVTVAPPAPANNNCSGATALSSGVIVVGSTQSATNDGSSSCGSTSTSPDVWFTYTASGTNAITIDTCGSSFDTVLTVYSGSCGALTEVACNDDNASVGPCPGGTTSYISFTPTSGTTYRIRVAGYAGASGSFNIRATGGNAPSPTAPAAPSNLVAGRSGSNSVLTWTDNSNNETRFVVERQQKVGSSWSTGVTFSDNAANDTSITVPTASGTWRWRVRAENGSLTSAWTAWVQQKVR
ncbi:MAG: S8 family serine peptidase [Phycisphaerales bacterium]